jgi:hypothetical protein
MNYQNVQRLVPSRIWYDWKLKNSKFKNLLSKESLNSDGQQFHQYQQNELSPHWTWEGKKGEKRPLKLMATSVQNLEI